MQTEATHIPVKGDKNNVPVYDVGLDELKRVSEDEAARRVVDRDFNEARGRDGARLHVVLKGMTEVDRRASERTRETLEALHALARRLEDRVTLIETRLDSFQAEARKQTEETTLQIQEARASLSHQSEASLQSISAHAQETSDRLAVDIRKLRDEVVSLVDSRMNQADASFAALRGDVEVVKYLVMDLIKDRIGRTDPKSTKGF